MGAKIREEGRGEGRTLIDIDTSILFLQLLICRLHRFNRDHNICAPTPGQRTPQRASHHDSSRHQCTDASNDHHRFFLHIRLLMRNKCIKRQKG